MSTSIRMSPRGFLYAEDPRFVTTGGTDVRTPVASSRVDVVLSAYAARLTPTVPVDQVLALTEAVKYAVGDLREWLKLNVENNGRFTERHLDFVHDTINFTQGKGRDLPMNAWDTLLHPANVDGITDKYVLKAKLTHVLKDMVKSEDLLAGWVSQPDGIEDFFHSAKILFGSLN